MNCSIYLYRQNVNNSDIMTICEKKAELQMKKGKYQYALTELQNAKPDSKDNKIAIARIYKNIAKCHEMLKEINDAMENYQIALQKLEEETHNENKNARNLLIADILLERGKLYVNQRLPEKAITDFNRAVDLSKDRSDSTSLAELYLERGKCFRELRQYTNSIKDLDDSITKLQKGTQKKQQAQAYNEYGYSFYENGQFEQVLYNNMRQWSNIIKQ